MTEPSAMIKRINDDFTAAMKSGDRIRLETLRLVRAALKEKEIALRSEEKTLTDEDVIATLATAAKKRREAIDEYMKAGRPDRAEAEKTELAIITGYLPEQMSPEEIEEAVRKVISETGAASPKDMGRVMSAVMPSMKGRADGREVQTIVKQLLGG